MSSFIEWVHTTDKAAGALTMRAVVAGHEPCGCNSPLWVIRASFDNSLIPGKLAVKRQEAYVPWDGQAHSVQYIEVCCAGPQDIKWVESCNGNVPPKAVEGGKTACGEQLYVGRAKHNGHYIPGFIQPSRGLLYMPVGNQSIYSNTYEVLCATC